MRRIGKTNSVLFLRTAALAIAAAYLFFGSRIASAGLEGLQRMEIACYKAQVVLVQERQEETVPLSETQTGQVVTLYFIAQLLEGENQGENVAALQRSDRYYDTAFQEVRAGDQILLSPLENSSQDAPSWQYRAHDKTTLFFLVSGLVLLCLLFLAGGKGLAFLPLFAFSLLAVFGVLMPAALSGQNLWLWATITFFCFLIFSLFWEGDLGRKSWVTGIGCLSGLLTSSALFLLSSAVLQLTGLSNRDALYLQSLGLPYPLNSEALLWIAVLVSMFGGALELSRTISSLLWERTQQEPDFHFSHVFSAGMVLGRERMGKMVSLWLFVYAGISFFPSLMLYAANPSSALLWSQDAVFTMALQALSGIFGLMFTLPFSSLAAAVVYGIGKNNQKEGRALSTDENRSSFLQELESTAAKEQSKNAFPVPVFKKSLSKERYPRLEKPPSFIEKKGEEVPYDRERKKSPRLSVRRAKERKQRADVVAAINGAVSFQRWEVDSQLDSKEKEMPAPSVLEQEKKKKASSLSAPVSQKNSFFRDVARYYQAFEKDKRIQQSGMDAPEEELEDE